MKVLFLHHQQRRHFTEEPGYNELFQPMRLSPTITECHEFVYQTVFRQYFQYEGGYATSDEAAKFQAYGRACLTFFPVLQQTLEICRPDIVINSSSWPHESVPPILLFAIQGQFPNVRIFTQLWDYDEGNPLLMWYEREIIKASHLVSICDNHARLQRIKRREGHYAEYDNVDAVVWLPTRPNPQVFTPRPPEAPRDIDICLLGSTEGFREQVVAALRQRYGSRFVNAGGYMPGDNYLSYADYANLIHRAKIIVNTQTRPEREQVKGRVREVLACGGFLLEQSTGETERFLDGSGVILWNDMSDLGAKIDRYLADEGQREHIAATAHAWYQERYPARTYFDEVLALLEKRQLRPG